MCLKSTFSEVTKDIVLSEVSRASLTVLNRRLASSIYSESQLSSRTSFWHRTLQISARNYQKPARESSQTFQTQESSVFITRRYAFPREHHRGRKKKKKKKKKRKEEEKKEEKKITSFANIRLLANSRHEQTLFLQLRHGISSTVHLKHSKWIDPRASKTLFVDRSLLPNQSLSLSLSLSMSDLLGSIRGRINPPLVPRVDSLSVRRRHCCRAKFIGTCLINFPAVTWPVSVHVVAIIPKLTRNSWEFCSSRCVYEFLQFRRW